MKNYLDSVISIVIICLSAIILQFAIVIALEFYNNGVVLEILSDNKADESFFGIFASGYFTVFIVIIMFGSMLIRIFTQKIKIFLFTSGIVSIFCQYKLLDLSEESSKVGAPIPLGIIDFFVVLPIVFGVIVFCYLTLRITFTNFPKIKQFAYLLTAIMIAGIIFGVTIESNYSNLTDKITTSQIISIITSSLPLIAVLASTILLIIILIVSLLYVGYVGNKNNPNITIPNDIKELWVFTRNRKTKFF